MNRADFPILNETVHGRPLVYLDNAATSQKPQCVIDAIVEAYSTWNSNIHRGVHHLSQVATAHHEEARKAVANFIGAKSSDEIVFTKGTTDSLNALAFSYGEAYIHEGDEIKTAALHPLTAVVVEAVHGEDLVFGDFLVFQCFDRLFQFVREGFVGVDAEDEVAGGEFVGKVFLVGIAEPVLGEELHAVAVADGLGRIGGMRVNDDDLVGNILNGVKALRDFLLLVEGDDDDRKGVHGRKFSAKVGFFSYF